MTAPLLALLAAAAAAAEPELILRGGKVFLAPGRYAEAVAVSGGRVSAVGPDAAVAALAGPKTRVVALRGRAVTPGFHDAHVHLLKGALSLTQADLNGSASVADVQAKLKAYADANPGTGWVQGRGWDHTAFPDKRYPTRQDLDAVASTRPVALTDVDGHKLWLNSEALRRTGITKDTKDPEGGQVLRDASGEPTGVLLESAMQLAKPAIPEPDRAAKLAALRRGLALARRLGVTSVQSVQGPIDVPAEEQVSLLRELGPEVTLRVFLYGRLEDATSYVALRVAPSGLPPGRLAFPGVKGFLDGVIGARTAALLSPYSDDAATSGALKYSSATLAGLVGFARGRGLQCVLHAIGDRAVRQALDVCSGGAPYSCKVDHIELVDAADVARFRAQTVAASMQPSHLTYDNEEQNYNPERLGGRVVLAFAWRSLQDAGALLAFGSDWPVMPLDPRVNLYAATTREHFNGKPAGGWVPEQKLTLEQALLHYSAGPARAAGVPDLGRIAPGQRADLVVFDRDLFALSGAELLKVGVDLTVFDGKVVFEAEP